jgi:hypothetical protein
LELQGQTLTVELTPHGQKMRRTIEFDTEKG